MTKFSLLLACLNRIEINVYYKINRFQSISMENCSTATVQGGKQVPDIARGEFTCKSGGRLMGWS